MIVRRLNSMKEHDAVITMYEACRVCKGLPLRNRHEYNIEKAQRVVKEALDSGHTSIAEHVNYRFYIDGISRACSHQLVRYRHCSFSQESLRSVVVGKNIPLEDLKDESKYEDLYEPLSAIFDANDADSMDACIVSLERYKTMVSKGFPAEYARGILPMCTRTKLIMTLNLRELMHICNERLCNRAQDEINKLAIKLREAVQDDFVSNLLVPKCKALGRCPEKDSCGWYPF